MVGVLGYRLLLRECVCDLMGEAYIQRESRTTTRTRTSRERAVHTHLQGLPRAAKGQSEKRLTAGSEQQQLLLSAPHSSTRNGAFNRPKDLRL